MSGSFPVAPLPEPLPERLYLWWLGQPQQPRLIGELAMARSLRGVSLRYHPSWLREGFALSEDLPLTEGEFLPREKDMAAGAVDDARPDRWGERVIRFLDRPRRLSVLDFLYYAGDERFGALGVSPSSTAYLPRSIGPLPTLPDVPAIEDLVQHILAGMPVDESQRRLVAPGVTFGGARPKALIHIDDEQWVVKFSEPGEDFDVPLVEHATMTLCHQAGINAAATRALALPQGGHAIAVRRFDRVNGQRVHAQSANVALKAAGAELGYPELAQLLRRRGVTRDHLARAQMRELFRRMVFNILIDNTDDHEKNHVLLLTDAAQLALSPAFDVLPSGQSLGYQQMRVGAQGHEASLDNALSQASQFGLDGKEAQAEVAVVAGVVAGWKDHFTTLGVSDREIDLLAGQIDRSALATQRDAVIQGRRR
ncbi:type II toxin-antitoxin system HipA family toxin [Roseateles sp. SL47]|uniref:type II toxin-antitoxin system HipA family toxin n=1 Tax=Roseateles sp. SL47 TaxID=2995138 RepID=UPI00226F45BC|nr:type II toxin-antitoxin system HipA family toxin [Roseateles sp. SL47]WAC75409.1 type II toxin-antitoxin system HipA family toxin [Roseateles sp. SL47]